MNKAQKRRNFEYDHSEDDPKQAKNLPSSSGLVFNHDFSSEDDVTDKFQQTAQIGPNMAVGLNGQFISIFRFQKMNSIAIPSKYQFTVKVSSVDSLISGLKAMKNYYHQLNNKNI